MKSLKPETNKQKNKKERVEKRINKLDPNNNKNVPGTPVVKRRGKKIHDDGFEHRTSEDTAFLA